MEFARLNDLERLRDLGTQAPWSGSGPIPVEVMRAAMARGRELRARAIRRGFVRLASAIARWARRLVPRLPAGVHGPDAINFDCAHGRPC